MKSSLIKTPIGNFLAHFKDRYLIKLELVNSDEKLFLDQNLQETIDPSELLPSDNSGWGTPNPSSALQNVNLLQAGYHIGIDTVGQSLRNANLQVRSEPANPQMQVGPWNNTTIEPDLMRVPLELGCGPQ